jgi:hypothetical protein
MAQVHLLGANASYDTNKQAVRENQIVVYCGMGESVTRFVVYKVEYRNDSCIYYLINTETRAFRQVDLICPLSQKFGIGFYYNDTTPEFMDAFEVLMLYSEAEYKARAEQEAQQKEQERIEQLKTIGRERLEKLIPADTKAVIIAEQHENDSDMMTDYFGYHTIRTVILGFSTHTRDLFSEMRKYAVNFEETAHLAEENEKHEHREKYTGGEGYFLGESRYSGWVIKKTKYYKDRESIINAFALTAGEESNVCVQTQAKAQPAPTITGDFLIVDYSQKALAVFGDTRPVKEQLSKLGGRFNPRLTHEGEKKAGWIFSKSKEQEVRELLTIK